MNYKNIISVLILTLLLFTAGCGRNRSRINAQNDRTQTPAIQPMEVSGTGSNRGGEIQTFKDFSEAGFDPKLAIIFRPDERAYPQDYPEDGLAEAGDEGNIAMVTTDDASGRPALYGKFETGSQWLLVRFPDYGNGLTLGMAAARTSEYGVDFIGEAVTAMEAGGSENIYFDIAFKDIPAESFSLSQFNMEEDSGNAERIVSLIREAYIAEAINRPAYLSSDTVMLKNIILFDAVQPALTVASFRTPEYNDSDSDLSNEVQFVICDGEVVYISAGMGCGTPHGFAINGSRNLYLTSHSYASTRAVILRFEGRSYEIIFDQYAYGD